MLGPGGRFGRDGGGLELSVAAWRRSRSRMAPCDWRDILADGAAAFEGECGGGRGIEGEAHAAAGVGVGGDILRGEGGLCGIGGKQRGDRRDGSVVAAGQVLGRVGGRGRESGAEGVDEVVVPVAGEEDVEAGGCGAGSSIHSGVQRYFGSLSNISFGGVGRNS